jgi:hypothetical protein
MRKARWTTLKQEECQPQHDAEVPVMRPITDIIGISPWRRKKGDTPIGYPG